MALKIELGNGGNAAAVLLADEFLNGTPISEVPAANGPGSAFDTTGQFVVPVPGGGTGGNVAISYNETDNAFTFDTTWNGVKNIRATSDSAESVVLKDFVHADVDFSNGGAVTGDSSVTIENVKRANVVTGAGDDTVSITLSTNAASWQNTVSVSTGDGNDSITIDAGMVSGAAKILDGSLTTVTIDAGAGNDSIDLSGVNLLASTVTGGAGNDTITGSDGADTFVYGASNTGNDTIIGYDALEDTLEFEPGVSIAFTYFNPVNGDSYLALSNGGSIILQDTVLLA